MSKGVDYRSRLENFVAFATFPMQLPLDDAIACEKTGVQLARKRFEQQDEGFISQYVPTGYDWRRIYHDLDERGRFDL